MCLLRVAQFNALAHICWYLRLGVESKDDFTDKSIYNIIEDLSPDLKYTMNACRWKQKEFNCSKYISPVITKHGLCFEFNGLNFNDMYTNR